MTQLRSLDRLIADNKKTRLGGFFVELVKAALEGSSLHYSFWRSMKLFMLASAKLNH